MMRQQYAVQPSYLPNFGCFMYVIYINCKHSPVCLSIYYYIYTIAPFRIGIDPIVKVYIKNIESQSELGTCGYF